MPDNKISGQCRCDSGAGSMSRRELMGSSFAAVGLCCVTEEAPAASFTIDNNTIKIDLHKVPALAKSGGAVRVVDLDREINLIVVHPEKDRYTALLRSCTHGGAQVAYSRKNKTVVCTSWGHSEFALDGTVLGGSAKRRLPTYPVRLEGRTLIIEVAA